MDNRAGSAAAPASEIDLRDVLRVLKRQRWLVTGVTLGCCLIAGLVTLKMPRIYEATSQMQFRPPAPAASSLIAASLPLNLGNNGTFKQTQLELLQNPAVADLIQQRLSQENIHITRRKLKNLWQPIDKPGSDLVDISATNTSPHVAETIANDVVFAFEQYKQQVDEASAQRDLATNAKRVSEARAAMERSSEALADFENRYHIINLPKQTEAKITELSTLRLAAGDANRKLQGAMSQVSTLEQQLLDQNRMITTHGERDDAVVEQLSLSLAEAETKLGQAQQKYVNFPQGVDPLKAEVDDIRSRLKTELGKATGGAGSLEMQGKLIASLHEAEGEVASAKAESDALNRQLMEETEGTRDLPGKEKIFAQLTETADMDRLLYTKTLETFQQIEMERLAHPSIFDITQVAELPDEPISPRPFKNLALGLFLGLLLGLGIALLLEYLDETVHSEEDLRDLVPDLPLLGSLPNLSGITTSRDAEKGGFDSRGPYRLLWLGVEFSALDEPLRTLVVTSTVPGEGKSLTCANLARAAAEEGKRVILVDCDLRRPSLHRLFEAGDRIGASEALAGKASLNDVLFQTDQPNLWLLPAGRMLPLNPAVLLKSERMTRLIRDLSARADLVIFDSPPAVAITDALLLASQCQGLLQVVEVDKGRREHIRKLIDAARRVRARHIGLVLNKVPLKGFEGEAYTYFRTESGPGTNGKAGHKLSTTQKR